MVACCGDYSISRTQMVFNCLDEICYKFDLEKPMWLDSTVQDFKYHDKARFTQDNFIETVDFDYLEIQVIEGITSTSFRNNYTAHLSANLIAQA